MSLNRYPHSSAPWDSVGIFEKRKEAVPWNAQRQLRPTSEHLRS